MQTGVTGRSLRARVPRLAGVLLQPLLVHTGHQHSPLRHPQHHGPQDRAWAAPATAAVISLLAAWPAGPQHPPLQSHSHTKAAWHQATTSTGYHTQKGPEEEALPTQITPLSSSSTAHTAHGAGESKHHCTPHTRHSLPVPRATRAKQPPSCRRGVGKPQPRTFCQICLASPPTCNFHWLLIVQAVAAASFRDLCPKGCLQKQVSEPARAQRSKKST